MPDSSGNVRSDGDERHVLGIYSDNFRDPFRGAHPLLIVRCSAGDARALRDALGSVEPAASGNFRSLTLTAWADAAAASRAAARTMAKRYADACAALDAAAVPWRGGDAAADARRDEVARAAGLGVLLFDLHLAARALARDSGTPIDEGRDEPTPAASLPAKASPPHAPPSSLRPLLGEPDRFVDDADVATFSGSDGPMPSEPAGTDARPDEVLWQYPEAGEPESASGYYVYALLEHDADSLFLESHPLVHTWSRPAAEKLVAILARVYPSGRNGAPAFEVRRGDRLDDIDRMLLDDRLAEGYRTGWLGDLQGETQGYLARIETDDVPTRRKEPTKGAPPGDACLQNAASAIDRAAAALARLRDAMEEMSRGYLPEAAYRTAHVSFAADVAPLLPKIAAAVDADAGLFDVLPALRDATGGKGRATGDLSLLGGVLDRADAELADVRRDLLVRLGPPVDAAAKPPRAAPSLLADPTRLPDVSLIVAAWTEAERAEASRLLAARPNESPAVSPPTMPDAGERDAPAKGGQLPPSPAPTQLDREREHAAKLAAAAEHLARHPAAGKEEVARAAGFHEKYFTRGKGAKLWDALKPRSNAIRRGYRRRDDSGEATGEVDAPDGADEAA